MIGALLFLGAGLIRRSVLVTIASLMAIVLTGVFAIPIFLLVPRTDANAAAMVALETAAGVALAALFVWRTTRRFPLFPATAALLIGIGASILVVRSVM